MFSMALSYSLSDFMCSRHRKCCSYSLSETVNSGIDSRKRARSTVTFAEGPICRIREAFSKVELSVSSYDTAWVAMVPSPRSPHTPCFPECIYWILENQHLDGSWGLPNRPPYLMKDALSSTLACVIALKRWNIGEEHVKRGLDFIGSNFSLATDAKQHSPIGFDIIFPGMIKHADDMGLHLHTATTDVDSVLCMQELALKRGSGRNSEGWKAFLAYVAEGLGKSQDWKKVMKYQRQNGSLFNSPSTTAAALTYCWDAKGHDYLSSLLRKFGNAVPTTYPLDIYTHLCMVDSLESSGVARHFRDEIKIVLDNTYRCWLQSDEEISCDIATCALAFRILRVNGYDVSSGALSQLNEDLFFSSMDGHLKDTRAVLELYKASQIKTSQDEQGLDKLNSWSSDFLKCKISKSVMQDELQQVITQEVNYALKFPSFANLERLEHKSIIENYSNNTYNIMKTSFLTENIDSKDILQLAVEDFIICQSIYREELDLLERWVENNRLDQLKFARQKLIYCYFSAAATLFHPDMSDVRISWAKNAVLTTVIDDFFDVGGSLEELKNFIRLVEKWDENYGSDCCSEQVRIVFSALYSTINELGAKASALQRQSVTSHLIEIWLNLIKSMMREAEWLWDNIVPTMDEYMTNGYVSFALGPIILPALYFVGPRLSWDIIGDPEYHDLYKLVSTCGRLLNDIQGFEREGSEGKLNSVSLYMLHGSGTISVEEAKKDIRVLIDTSRTELRRLVLQTEGSVVPRSCKDLFWNMCKILHLFYMNNDGFTSPKEMVRAVNAVIHEPLIIPNILLSDD